MKNNINEWYFKTPTLIIAFLCVGPFMLPLVWFNPRFSRKTKIVASLAIGVVTYCLGLIVANSLKNIVNYYSLVLEYQ